MDCRCGQLNTGNLHALDVFANCLNVSPASVRSLLPPSGWSRVTDTEEITLAVKFDTNKAIVKPEYFAEIRRVATFMNQYENTQVVVVGHTDSRGSASYNQELSQRRAAAVAAVLVREHGISASRVASRGAGESSPIASNDTKEGRAQNRRVVGEVSAQIQKYIEK